MEKQHIKALLEAVTVPGNMKENEIMQAHTTFRIGGPAWFYMTPQSVEELAGIVRVCKSQDVPFYIIGNGSNLLVPDEGVEGVVIELYKNMSNVVVEGTKVTAQCGALLARIAKEALEASLTGLEFAHGIPGTLGGALAMNAGAYGGEMKDVVCTVKVLTEEGEVMVLTNEEMNFGYRHSILSKKGYIALEATLELIPGDKEAISSTMKELMGRRKDKQPLEYPSAGSTFKRPPGHFAGKLIMDSGLRGYQIGGAQVAEKHCGFVINRGEATCSDVLELIAYVQQEVEKQFGIVLETEVKVLGAPSHH